MARPRVDSNTFSIILGFIIVFVVGGGTLVAIAIDRGRAHRQALAAAASLNVTRARDNMHGEAPAWRTSELDRLATELEQVADQLRRLAQQTPLS